MSVQTIQRMHQKVSLFLRYLSFFFKAALAIRDTFFQSDVHGGVHPMNSQRK